MCQIVGIVKHILMVFHHIHNIIIRKVVSLICFCFSIYIYKKKKYVAAIF